MSVAGPLDEAALTWIAAEVCGCQPVALVDHIDMAALAWVTAEHESVVDPVMRAAILIRSITSRAPFPRHNAAIAWLAAAYVLDGEELEAACTDEAMLDLLETAATGALDLAGIAAALDVVPRGHRRTRSLAWTCPACARSLRYYETDVIGVRTILVGSSRFELTARCSAEHGAHDRFGLPALVDDHQSSEVDSWHPVVRSTSGDAFVVLGDAATYVVWPRGGDLLVHRVPDLAPGDLVGSWERLLDRAELVGAVRAADVRFDVDDRVDLASLTVGTREMSNA